MGYLDSNGLARLWDKIKGRSPKIRNLTQSEYDTLPEEEKQSETIFVITDKPPFTMDAADERYLKLSGGTIKRNGYIQSETIAVSNTQHPYPVMMLYGTKTTGESQMGTTYHLTARIKFASPNEDRPMDSPVPTMIRGVAPPVQMEDAANKEYVDNAVAEASGVPSGAIILWSGSEDAIPSGWVLCNGEHNTPDLRGRFVLGAGGEYSPGATGGSEEVVLTVDQMPEHKHQAMAGFDEYQESNGYTQFKSGTIGNFREIGMVLEDPMNQAMTSVGKSKPHPNMPPYYALCYLMKI